MIAKIAFPIPLRREFDYLVPPALESAAVPGARVRTQFGPRWAIGFIVSVSSDAPAPKGFQLKAISEILDVSPCGGAHLLPLALFMKRTWGGSLGEILGGLVPEWAPANRSQTAVSKEVVLPEASFSLNEGQRAVLDSFMPGKAGVTLLTGRPKTGKTEVCLRAAAEAVRRGGQALVIAPDFAMLDELRLRTEALAGSGNVVVWHSKVTPAGKKKVWETVVSGAPLVLVGTRSAALLPFAGLSFCAVCDEHDSNCKEEDQKPYYDVRSLIEFRAGETGVPLVLCSSVPSVESMVRARSGAIRLAELAEPVRPAGYSVVITAKKGSRSKAMSDELLASLEETLAAKGQALLILNRKGFAAVSQCVNCGWMPKCSNCGAPLPYAEPGRPSVTCRSCGRENGVTEKCPRCACVVFRSAGAGTQRAAAELKKLFPSARVLRLDSGTLVSKGGEGYIAARAMREGTADIVVGTRMLARGYDFPLLRTAAVLDADTEMAVADFRASEKTAQMLFQAAGMLSGGKFFIQTANPACSVFEAVQKGDYAAFAAAEAEERQVFRFPPFSRLFRILVSGPKPKPCEKALAKIAAAAAEMEKESGIGQGEAFDCASPSPAFVPRAVKSAKWQLVVKASSPELASRFLDLAWDLKPPKGYRLRVIADPVDFH